MTNPTQPAVKLTVDGATYHLRFDFEAVAQAEDLTGRPLLTGLRERDVITPTISLVRAMLLACLLPDQPDITLMDAKSIVSRSNLVEVWGKVLEAWTASLAEPGEEAVPADPMSSQS